MAEEITNIKPARVLDVNTGREIPGSTLVKASADDINIVWPSKQVLQGKLTAIGAAITGVSGLASAFGIKLPAQEINGIFTWLLANWDSIGVVVGLGVAAFGQIRQLWRKPPAVVIGNPEQPQG